MKKSNKIIRILIALSIVIIFLAFVFRKEIFTLFIRVSYSLIKPPDRSFCLNTDDDYRCITDKALQEKNAGYCYYLDASRSDQCIDEITAHATSPEICKKIKQSGDREFCLKKFQ